MIDLANGYRSGFGNALTYYNLSTRNFSIQNQAFDLSNGKLFYNSWIQSSWKIAKTALKAHRVAPTLSLLSNHRTAIKCMAVSWAGMNLLAVIQHELRGCPRIGYTLVGKIWENTPQALLMTNVALTILELQVNFTKAFISLLSMGISYLDFKDNRPHDRNVIWNWVLPLSMRGIVFYYGNRWQRLMITVDFVSSSIKFYLDIE